MKKKRSSFWGVIIVLFLIWFVSRFRKVYFFSIPETVDTHVITDIERKHFIRYDLNYYSSDAEVMVSASVNGTFRIAWEGSNDGVFRHVVECDFIEKNGKVFNKVAKFVLSKDTLNKYSDIFIIFIPGNSTEGKLKIKIKEKWYLVVKREILRFWNY